MSDILNYHIISCKYYDPKKVELSYIRKISKGVKGKKILDIGCGTGRLSSALSKAGAIVTGIDINKEFISYCSHRFKRSNTKFKLGDARNLPFKDSAFDIVLYAWGENLGEDTSKALRESKRVLKPKGKIILIDEMKGSDYASLIKRFDPNIDQYLDLSIRKLRNSLTKLYKKIEFYKKVRIPYVFPNVGEAYKMMVYDLGSFRGIRLNKDDKLTLRKNLSKFASGKRIVLNEAVMICSCTKQD